MDRIAHPFEVRFAEQLGHGRNGNGCRLWYKHRMAAFFVRAGIVGVMRSVVMQEGCFPTNWAGRVILRSGINTFWGIRRPLMFALFALILLVSMNVFSIAKKVRFVVAFRAADLI